MIYTSDVRYISVQYMCTYRAESLAFIPMLNLVTGQLVFSIIYQRI